MGGDILHHLRKVLRDIATFTDQLSSCSEHHICGIERGGRTAISLFIASSFSRSLLESSCLRMSFPLSSGVSNIAEDEPRMMMSLVCSEKDSCMRIPRRDAFSEIELRFKAAMIFLKRSHEGIRKLPIYIISTETRYYIIIKGRGWQGRFHSLAGHPTSQSEENVSTGTGVVSVRNIPSHLETSQVSIFSVQRSKKYALGQRELYARLNCLQGA